MDVHAANLVAGARFDIPKYFRCRKVPQLRELVLMSLNFEYDRGVSASEAPAEL